MATVKKAAVKKNTTKLAPAAKVEAPAPKKKKFTLPKMEGELPTHGKATAPIVVICDPPTGAQWEQGAPLDNASINLFSKVAADLGFDKKDFYFISCSAPIPEIIENSDSRIKDYIEPWRDEMLGLLDETDPKLLVYLGKWAGQQLMGRPSSIMKARGSFTELNDEVLGKRTVLPLFSPRMVLRRPEVHDIFRTDFRMIQMLKSANWKAGEVAQAKHNYHWCTDLKFLLDNPPKLISCDTETTGLKWYLSDTQILTVQIGYGEGNVAVCPVDCKYYPKLSKAQRIKLVGQLRTLLENPKVLKTGHNIKFDAHMLREDLGIDVQGWDTDTQLLIFSLDENMQTKSLDEGVRRWVPEMAGYNDALNDKIDKSNMRSVSHEDMLAYAGGDADATLRLALKLKPLCMQDKRNWACYRQIIMPAIEAFLYPIEYFGIQVDTTKLAELQLHLDGEEKRLYSELIKLVPKAIKRKHIELKKGKIAEALKFTRDEFLRDILFTKEGYGLTPKQFTKTTERLPPEQRVPSVSAKTHLPYFSDEPFVAMLMEYIKMAKLRGTYVGKQWDDEEQAPTGFWKYIHNDEIHPSYMLHRTNTGRTASADPNGQNFPKRGKLAKAYREIFRARPGYVFIETDLSQAEVRIAAWMAGEENMIKIYKAGGDIHAATAAAIMGVSLKEFYEFSPEVIAEKRQQAKACVFGFLYGMGWRKFKAYAKTDYGVEFTDEEAMEMRERFFELYPRLAEWHNKTREWLRKHGYVRALHGAMRNLPSINSEAESIQRGTERQSINAPVQRFASDLGLIALRRIVRDFNAEDLRPVAFIHDALIIEVKEELAAKACEWVKFYMESPPLKQWFNITPPLPIVADIKMGKNLGKLEDVKGVKAKAPKFYNPKWDDLPLKKVA